MVLYVTAVIFGFALIIWGADRFVDGAGATAHRLGVSPLLIGLTVVGLGTSAPEMLVSANAAFTGSPGIAIGNALGSNIANIGLILGITALISPLVVRSETLGRELPLLLAITLISLLPFMDGYFSRVEGLFLIAGLALMMFGLVMIETRGKYDDPMHIEAESEIRSDLSLQSALTLTLMGLAVLLLSSHILVWGAKHIAAALGVSDLIIGLTVIAIGTSLPELAASVSAARKNEHDLAIGNVIGSNMFNLLAVMGIAGTIQPTGIDPAVLQRDFPVMIGLTLILFAMAYNWSGDDGRISRVEGIGLLIAFIIYQGYLIYGAST